MKFESPCDSCNYLGNCDLRRNNGLPYTIEVAKRRVEFGVVECGLHEPILKGNDCLP